MMKMMNLKQNEKRNNKNLDIFLYNFLLVAAHIFLMKWQKNLKKNKDEKKLIITKK